MAVAEANALDWLLRSPEPAVRYLARRDLLGEDADPAAVLDGPAVRALCSGQREDGGFGVRPYGKWTGAHWRIVSMVELGVPPGEPHLVAAAENVLAWLGRRRAPRIENGLVRVCASIDGNALAACCRAGLGADPRVEALARGLVAWQWPDGGWNCDPQATGRRSSFHESLIPAWGLHEYHRATGAAWARDAALRTAELLLEHRLFRSLSTGEAIDPAWLRLRYPSYWHYDVLHALLVLSRLGVVRDARARDALELLRAKRLSDGRWKAEGAWWRSTEPGASGGEVVDWGRTGPNAMVTLNALRVLQAAGAAPA